MFHAARSLLYRDGIKERSHLCVIAYLQETYPNLKTLALQLDTYRRNRHNSCYALDFLVSDNEAVKAIEDAQSFYQKIQKIIEEK
jgi:uncharacterized protein (UPF0332 family)